MFLQYKSFNNNWTLEEAESITYAYLDIDEITSKYRNCADLTDKEKLHERGKPEFDLARAEKMHKEVTDYIIKETHAGDDIVFCIGDLQFSKMTHITIAMLSSKNKRISYVFDRADKNKSVYILNSCGQTVQKLV